MFHKTHETSGIANSCLLKRWFIHPCILQIFLCSCSWL